MIPDKIYVKMFSYGVGYVNSSEEKLKDEGIEFIRKDALIEWATNLKERWKEPPVSVHSPGCVYMLEQVIDKLNSM